MMKSLKKKIIVVTGSSGLLGREMVGFLESYEATVVGVDVIAVPGAGETMICDTTVEADLLALVDKIMTTYGRIDGWVNNAYPRTKDWGKKIEDVPFDSWRTNVELQLNSYFLCCRTVLEKMKNNGGVSIVNMSSIYGMVGPDFSIYEGTEMTTPVAYSAIKGGLLNLTRYLASYYGRFGCRINAVSPGGIIDKQPASFIKHYTDKVPLKRLGNPTDISPAVAFLLSDEAGYITGHNLVVDGGWTAI